MIFNKGEIWLANLNPTKGSEQAGVRPVLIFQNNYLNQFTTTLLTIPFTSNLRRAALPSCIKLEKGEGGLDCDSVALCHQLRVLDKLRLMNRLGSVSDKTLLEIKKLYAIHNGN